MKGTNMTSLQGTVALVTGASSGIGAAVAIALAEQGAAVAVIARRRDRLNGVAEAITGRGGEVLIVEADVTSRKEIEDAVGTTVAHFGRLDIVVANAGVMLLGPAVGAPIQEWERMVDLNVSGLLYTAHACLPHLLKAAEGAPRAVADLILISSGAGRVAHSGSAVYSATKHAVGAFGEALRQEVTKRHVRVGIVEPGAVETELSSHNRPEVMEGISERFGNIEAMNADDIGDLIAYIVTRPRHVALNEVLIRPTDMA
jgi:NADP-dependent 3-hydroxy acid dehydrogenase YdfG